MVLLSEKISMTVNVLKAIYDRKTKLCYTIVETGSERALECRASLTQRNNERSVLASLKIEVDVFD